MSKVSEFKSSQERVDEGGKVTGTRIFMVQFAVGDPAITPKQAAADLADGLHAPLNEAVALASPFPGEAAALCRQIKVEYAEDCIYRIICKYSSYTNDPKERSVNDEEVRWDISTQTTRIYRGRAAGPPDATFSNTDEEIGDEIGDEGLPALAPVMRVSVSRIHSSMAGARLTNAYSTLAHTNSNATYTTPGGTLIASAANVLLFTGFRARQLDTNKWQVDYEFLVDPQWYHKARWRPRDTDDGEHDNGAVTMAHIYREKSFAALMADE